MVLALLAPMDALYLVLAVAVRAALQSCILVEEKLERTM